MNSDRPTCDVCGLPATTTDGICGAELCDDPECFGVAWDRAFVAERPVVERERAIPAARMSSTTGHENGPESAVNRDRA